MKKSSKKRKTDLVAKLDKVFSAYIRLRDVMPNGYFVCVSCGQVKPFSQADCGHFVSRRHMSLRFDEMNCHAECRACNRFTADHLIGYQANLIRRLGQARYELLVSRREETKKWSDFELEQMIRYYTIRVKQLEQEKGIRVT